MSDESAVPSAEEQTKESKPRQPRLTLTCHGETQALLKYPFPVKAAHYPVKVNGEEAIAATTSGRGKSYTYILYKNTSFYVPGTLPVDTECTIAFPEGYKFDETKQTRSSSYKPKKKAKKEGNGEESKEAPSEGSSVQEVPEAGFPQPHVMEGQGQKATRRVKGSPAP